MAPLTQADQLAAAILSTFAGPYYVAATPTQRDRIIHEAAKTLAPLLESIATEAKTLAALQNPS